MNQTTVSNTFQRTLVHVNSLNPFRGLWCYFFTWSCKRVCNYWLFPRRFMRGDFQSWSFFSFLENVVDHPNKSRLVATMNQLNNNNINNKLLRTVAVELHMDFESLESENQAGLELLQHPIEDQVPWIPALHAYTRFWTSWAYRCLHWSELSNTRMEIGRLSTHTQHNVHWCFSFGFWCL